MRVPLPLLAALLLAGGAQALASEPSFEQDLQTRLEALMAKRAAVPLPSGSLKSYLSSGASGALKFGTGMGKFFLLVGGLNYQDCWSTRDPSRCEAFLESLEKPETYAGFAMFVAGSTGTSSAVFLLSHSPGWSRYLGLAGGALLNDLYSNVIANPLVEEYRQAGTISDAKLRRQTRSALLAEALAQAPSWSLERLPSLASVLGGSVFSSMMNWAIQRGLLAEASTLRQAGGPAVLADLFEQTGKSYKLIQLSGKGVTVMLDAARLTEVNPLILLSVWLIEDWGFLKASDIIERKLTGWMDERTAANELQGKLDVLLTGASVTARDFRLEGLEGDLATGQTPSPWLESEFESEVRDVESAWDKFRESQTEDARRAQGSYRDELDQFHHTLLTTYNYYLWLLSGMDFNSAIWADNSLAWHLPVPGPNDFQHDFNGRNIALDPLTAEIRNHVRSFFCGADPAQAVHKLSVVHGMPVPATRDEVVPWKAVNRPDLCLSPADISRAIDHLGPGNGPKTAEEGIAFYNELEQRLDFRRMAALRSSSRESLEKESDATFARVLAAAQEIKDSITDRYERAVTRALQSGLRGQQARYSTETFLTGQTRTRVRWETQARLQAGRHSLARGAIPAIEEERQLWLALNQRYGHVTQVFWHAAERAQKIEDTHKGVLGYYSGSAERAKALASGIAPSPADALFDSLLNPDWAKVVTDIRGFILRESGPRT